MTCEIFNCLPFVYKKTSHLNVDDEDQPLSSGVDIIQCIWLHDPFHTLRTSSETQGKLLAAITRSELLAWQHDSRYISMLASSQTFFWLVTQSLQHQPFSTPELFSFAHDRENRSIPIKQQQIHTWRLFIFSYLFCTLCWIYTSSIKNHFT